MHAGLEVLRPAGPPFRYLNHPSEVARRHLQLLSRRPDTPGSWSRTPGARPDRSLPPDPPVVETSAHSMRHSTTGTGAAPAPSANAALNGRGQLSAGQVRPLTAWGRAARSLDIGPGPRGVSHLARRSWGALPGRQDNVAGH